MRHPVANRFGGITVHPDTGIHDVHARQLPKLELQIPPVKW